MVTALTPRLEWQREQIAAERTIRLRALIAHAKTFAPWHRHRLQHIDPNTVTEADLERIPPMTKADLVEHFEGIVTDRRLTLNRLLAHLNGPLDNVYLDEHFIAATSSGTTGTPTVCVYDRTAFSIMNCLILRWRLRNAKLTGRPFALGNVASLYADNSTQVQIMAAKVFPPSPNRFSVPVTRPLPWMVSQLNVVKPGIMIGASSIMAILAEESAAGRLDIAPQEIVTTAELLSGEMRQAILRQWPAKVLNVWGMSEGLFAVPCHTQDHQHLPDDLAIVEPVTAAGERVGDRVVSNHVLFTNLYNYAQPLIRLTITDQVAVSQDPCPCGSHHHRVVALEGRVEDQLVFRGTKVVSFALLLPLWRVRHVVTFQLRQTTNGIHVLLVQNGPVDHNQIAAILRGALLNCGIENTMVTVEQVDGIKRTKAGKHRYVVALHEKSEPGPSSGADQQAKP